MTPQDRLMLMTKIWEETTTLPADSPLHASIIREFLEGAEPLTRDNIERIRSALVADIREFAAGLGEIAERGERRPLS